MDWKLNEQVCFLLYANSRNIIKTYKDVLDPLNLTYTQYITMIALWEKDHQLVSDLGHRLALDSGTLTPLLKKLELDGRITRTRDDVDQRKVWIDLTEKGKALSIEAESIPKKVISCVPMDMAEGYKLYELLRKLYETDIHCK
ncbi:MAG: MarR family transcriptional regulator [Acholeplasma sp.]|jgi:DNA-binding MarR family transcriptional regulator|nr:MarR family transcriptional regulator [Acholeplasma sp.]